MADGIYPRKLFTSASNWASGAYTSETMHSAIREGSIGKVSKNDPSVFKHLGIDQVPDALVNPCFEMSASQNQELFDELESATAAVANAYSKSSFATDPTAGLDERAKGKGWEVEMYSPLVSSHASTIMQLHRQFLSEHTATRNVTIAANRQLKDEQHMTGFPNVLPDGTGSSVPECNSWMDVAWFTEIKPKEDQGVAAKDTTISEVVCPAADYARLRLSSRPFQLFSVSFLIFGPKFTLGILDKDGISLSSIFDFYDGDIGFKTFIKVIRRLVSPCLTDIGLGRDPTVSSLPNGHPLHAAVRSLATTLGISPNFPPFMYGSYGMGSRSMGDDWPVPYRPRNEYLVCGSNYDGVRHLEYHHTGDVSILKNAWRNSDRTGEAVIYGSLNRHPPGVARFLQGGDVVFPETDMKISVHNLRAQYPYVVSNTSAEARGETNDSLAPGAGTAVFQRLIGWPSWHFVSYLELLKAFRAAIVGHQQLVDHGILHRDISASNIMISATSNPTPGEEGFLMDLEFARIDEVVHFTAVQGGPKHTTWSAPRRGIQMTPLQGTVQFMAREVLESVISNKPIEHAESHDLESFAWVFAYVVLRRLLRDSKDENTTFSKNHRMAIKELYDQSFGALQLETVLTQRNSFRAFDIRKSAPGTVPSVIAEFMQALGVLVRANYVDDMSFPTAFTAKFRSKISLPSQTKMIHSDLLGFIQVAIEELAKDMQIA